MLFGGDGLQKGFCFGSTFNLHFFPYKVSRRSSHSNRGFRRFHDGDFKIYISLYAHDKVQFAMCYWTAQFERYCIEHLNTSCFENTKSFRPCTPLIIYGLMKLSLYYSWRTWSYNRGRMSRYREFKSGYTRPLWFSQSATVFYNSASFHQSILVFCVGCCQNSVLKSNIAGAAWNFISSS